MAAGGLAMHVWPQLHARLSCHPLAAVHAAMLLPTPTLVKRGIPPNIDLCGSPTKNQHNCTYALQYASSGTHTTRADTSGKQTILPSYCLRLQSVRRMSHAAVLRIAAALIREYLTHKELPAPANPQGVSTCDVLQTAASSR
jgi:hypothetical protein